jgi:PGF-pre-PGF domain-containing protein
MTLAPGLYKWGTGVLINAGGSGDPNGVTLDCQGNANAVFIFQIAQTLTVGNGAIVTLSGNCQAQNIFWQVAGQTTLGTTSVFNGNILDQTVIVLNTGATLNGRALAQTAVTLDSNNVSVVAAPSAWRNADFNVTLNATGNATGFNNTQIAYINYSLNNVPGQINGSTGNVLISTNGNNTLTFYAVDILGNVETPNTIHALLDKIPPNITSFTLSATSVNTGDAVIGTCTVTDNLATNITGIITGIDTTTAGSKTATCTATDLAGNIATASAPYTVNTVPSEPSRGGDGNGFLSSGNSQAFSYPQMDEGFHSIDFTKEGVAVTHIELETTGIANNVYMTATQLAGKPTNAPTPAIEKLYGYLQIDHNNLGNSLIGSAKIRFKVAKAWMVSNSVQPDQIALYRFTSQWDLLATTMISQDSAYYYFDASSPGLSYFAIGSINTVTTMIPTAPPEPTTPQTPSPVTPGQDNNAVPPNGGIPITGLATGQGGYYPSAVSIAFVIVVVIGLLIGGFFYFRSRNKPPVHH